MNEVNKVVEALVRECFGGEITSEKKTELALEVEKHREKDYFWDAIDSGDLQAVWWGIKDSGYDLPRSISGDWNL